MTLHKQTTNSLRVINIHVESNHVFSFQQIGLCFILPIANVGIEFLRDTKVPWQHFYDRIDIIMNVPYIFF